MFVATADYVVNNKDIIGTALGIPGLVAGVYRYAIPRTRTFKFLHEFFADRHRAQTEWWSARVWWPWGALKPLERARLRAELDILNPLDKKPNNPLLAWRKRDRTASRRWRAKRRRWCRQATLLTKRLEDKVTTDAVRWGKYSPEEFAEVAPWIAIDTPADLDKQQRRERIAHYFSTLEGLKDAKLYDFGSFLTYVKIEDGYIAPAFLIAGLMTRFDDDWKLIIRNYRSVLESSQGVGDLSVRLYSQELEEIRSFQFNCWLLWGPSIPLCTCDFWNEERLDQEASSKNLIMQYGFGDEANCVDFHINTPAAAESYSIWLKTVENTRPGQPRHVGAIPSALFGQIMWGSRVAEADLCRAQKAAIVGHPGMDGLPEVPGRVVLKFTKRVPTSLSGVPFSNYYSAYVWVMFALVRRDGTLYYTQRHRNLLPFFEHGNIADATTLQTAKESLVAKCLSALAEIVQRAGDEDVLIEYVCACDHSGCGSETRFPPNLPSVDPEETLVDQRLPRIIDILKSAIYLNSVFTHPKHAARLKLPTSHICKTYGDAMFSSCCLPDIIEEFIGDVSKQTGKYVKVHDLKARRLTFVRTYDNISPNEVARPPVQSGNTTVGAR